MRWKEAWEGSLVMAAFEQAQATNADDQSRRVRPVGLAQPEGSARAEVETLTTEPLIRSAEGLDTTTAGRIRSW
jgi:hypothetical protein